MDREYSLYNIGNLMLINPCCSSGLAANTSGISGATSKKFMSKIAALEHFTAALGAGLVFQHTLTIERVTL